MGKTMSVVSLFKFILFFALVKMFYSLLDYIKKNRAIEKSVYRIYSTADERYEKRKEQKEKIYFEEGNVENTSFFYRLDLLIERSEIRKKIPFLSTEIYLLFLGIISVIAFVIGNLIFGLIGAVLGITLSILIIHSSLYILARLNYERVDNEITKFVNLVESYSVSSNDPLRTYIETFYNEVSTTGDYDRAFMNLKNKAESERLKRVIENIELASQNEANYNEIIDDERNSLKAYSNAKEKRKELIAAGRSDIIACLIMGFATIYMLSSFTTGLGNALLNDIIGNLILVYWIITLGYIVWKFISLIKEIGYDV